MKKSIQALFTLSAIAAGSLLSSCDSMIFDDQGDCSVHYRVPITYTQNVMHADAFYSQVTSVTLYAFDEDGNLALTKTESGEPLTHQGYAMDVELQPGTYSILVWANGDPTYSPTTQFEIGGGNTPSSITDLSATLPLSTDPTTGTLYSDRDIIPLYHGYAQNVEFPDTYGTVTLPAIDLTKDTNVLNVAIENFEGLVIEPDAVSVTIEADNSHIAWDNTIVSSTPFVYRPWSVTSLSSERPNETRDDDDNVGPGADETNPLTGLLSELTTGRIMADRKPILVVHRKYDDKDILRLDLVKFLCMVKGNYSGNLTDQEYLDCISYFNLAFFVDADLNWYTAGGININGWKVVSPQDMEL
ncbi:MAG: FimB/Mfa2 family fimbrial subunit [Muribaculaceae bacterium]|nr:FimB/Mfa2 family fimbrial subunit [Muribaculaceae bacterium]